MERVSSTESIVHAAPPAGPCFGSDAGWLFIRPNQLLHREIYLYTFLPSAVYVMYIILIDLDQCQMLQMISNCDPCVSIVPITQKLFVKYPQKLNIGVSVDNTMK